MSSGELLTIYDEGKSNTPISVERSDFYENRRTTYADKYLGVIDVILFNTHGEILLQKRSRRKKNMPGQFHTTIGGHINFGEMSNFTALHESIEEIGTPSVVIDDQEFSFMLKKVGQYTNSFALLKLVKDYYRKYEMYRDPFGREVPIQDKISLYFGVYDGGFTSKDRSSDGCERFSFETLLSEMKNSPEIFTVFLHSYIEEFHDDIISFVELIKSEEV